MTSADIVSEISRESGVKIIVPDTIIIPDPPVVRIPEVILSVFVLALYVHPERVINPRFVLIRKFGNITDPEIIVTTLDGISGIALRLAITLFKDFTGTSIEFSVIISERLHEKVSVRLHDIVSDIITGSSHTAHENSGERTPVNTSPDD